MEKLLRTQEVAKICQVSQGTVIRWVKEGRLPASATAGGHNRIRLSDLVELLRSLRFPIPVEFLNEQKIKILIVDDEPGMRDMIRWMIEQDFQNMQIEEADEGFVAGWKTHSFQPDLVILDLMLPGLDGFGICQFIREFPELKNTKIIAISALLDAEVEKKIREMGADECLVKPFQPDLLKQKILELLKNSGKKVEMKTSKTLDRKTG